MGRVKLLLLVMCILSFSFAVEAQKEMKLTSSFVIQGKVKRSVTITETDLRKLKTENIGDVAITNHLGEPKSTSKALKGVLLRDVLGLAQIESESPKVLSEYYFVCKAADGYIVVYSWNELFNTSTGDSAFIVIEKDGMPFDKMDDRVLMISSKDFRTGRRHLKALASIDVRRAE